MKGVHFMRKFLNKKWKGSVVCTILLILFVFVIYPIIRGNSKVQFDSITQHEIEHPSPKKVRGSSYNEILVVYRYFNKLKAGVYNDIGKALIAEEDFAKISTEEVKKEFGATAVIKNGPRFWVMDEITGYYNGSEQIIANHLMNQPGILNLSFQDLKNRIPYSVHQINRKTDYTYYKNQKVYQIVTDQGDVFTMQSASKEVDKEITIDTLDNLGLKLNLPAGWSYQMSVLKENVTYHIDGTAYVLQDEFLNTYQKTSTNE